MLNVNVYKGKGGALERGNYSGIKLLHQILKVTKRALEGFEVPEN